MYRRGGYARGDSVDCLRHSDELWRFRRLSGAVMVDVESQTVCMLEERAKPFDKTLMTLNRLLNLANAEKCVLLGDAGLAASLGSSKE